MAWSVPTAGQWNPSIGVTPEGNMTSYTPEQWAALQQQNWQQWAQWQQQYATWQSQYGSKYVEQMQALQTMTAMPPLPPANTAPPPAPPPPDKPPPPPHENNQPLYGNGQRQLVPVSAPGQNIVLTNNITDSSAGYNHNRLSATDAHPESTESTVNSEALKTLAEEEKAFDIQFQKWEEEIEKWKKANVNHPDKKAYQEYEQRFESCRARLLERRQQMKQKRAKLLGTIQQQVQNTPPRHNVTIPPPGHTPVSTDYVQNKNHVLNNPPPQNFSNTVSKIPQFNSVPQQDYPRENNKNFDPHIRYESYSNAHTAISTITDNLIPTESFLPRSDPLKGIPGLDLVPAGDKLPNKVHDVVDITINPMEKQLRIAQQGPDYSKISKGINNILGDEKIMNILSMVRGQSHQINNNLGMYGTDSENKLQNNYWERNESYNDNYQMGQNISYDKQHGDYSMVQENNQASKYVMPPEKQYDNRQNTMPQDQFFDKGQAYNRQGVLPMMQQTAPQVMQQNVRPNMPMRSLLDPIPQQNEYTNDKFDRRGVQNEIHVPPGQVGKQNVPPRQPPPARPGWVEDPLFTPSIIVEYEHKPLRLKARDFIEPVHTFDYNHQSKDGDVKKKDFEKEAEELFIKHPRIPEKEDRYPDRHRDLYYRDQERTLNRGIVRDFRDDHYPRAFRDENEDRRKYDDDIAIRRYEERRQDDRDKYRRREDLYRERDREREDMFRDRERDLERNRDSERFRERDRDMYKDRFRDYRRSKSRDKENRKRRHSKDIEINNVPNVKKPKDATPVLTHSNEKPRHTVIMVDDILELPGRQMRPDKIVIILRGPPGSGKSYLAKLIRDREAEHGGTVRVMSIDDYFMQEGEIEEKDPTTGKVVKKPSLKYEYDETQEENYLFSLKRAFKRSITDGFFTFLIYDAVNEQLRNYADIWNYARQCGFQVYVCTMDLDPQVCFKRNIHNRKLEEIESICSRFFPTPNHHIQLDPTTLLQNASIPDVQMEDAADDVTMEETQETEVNNSFTSKWEKMDDAAQLARLDGTSKPLRPSQPSMEDYLQLDDWKPNASQPGKKTVRWADIEERRQQEKMRAIGFVVGQTDWNRMTDPTMGSSALTQTKYIERVKRP